MTDPRHARILANIAAEVGAKECGSCGGDIGPSDSYPWHLAIEDCRAIRQPVERQRYTLTRSGSTPDPDKGNVPVPEVDPSWNYTLPEEYQA